MSIYKLTLREPGKKRGRTFEFSALRLEDIFAYLTQSIYENDFMEECFVSLTRKEIQEIEFGEAIRVFGDNEDEVEDDDSI